MAAPTYATDLVDLIADSDTTAWGELTGAIAGGAPDEADTESALQGTNSVSQTNNTTSLCSMCRILASPVTLNTGDVFLVWHAHGVATSLLTYASGGLRLAVASALANWKGWAVGGSDVAPHPYGKWVNNPIDPTITYEYSNGTPPTGLSFYGVGSMCQLASAVAKGQPHVVDIIRYGRAQARISGGESGNYATFSGFAAKNDANNGTDGYNRWGLLQTTMGGYLWKGLMTIGYGAACAFVDLNQNIFVQDCRKVYSAFNRIEVKYTGTTVSWDGIAIICVSPTTTASKGEFEVVDNVSVTIAGCNFVDLSTFIFRSSSSITETTFRRCGQVTQGGATLDGCSFINSPAAVSLLVDNLDNITNCEFTSDGSNHAMQLTSAHAGNSYTLVNCTYTNYASSDGTSGNECIYNDSGGAVTINVSGGETPSIRNGSGATTTVVSGSVTVTVTAQTAAGVKIQDANVLLAAADGGGFPFEDTVTIVNSGTTATVTHTGHAMASSDKVLIKGASLAANNGVFSITLDGVDPTNKYSYTMSSSPGSSPTGTITSTFVLIKGMTNVSGVITMSRVFGSNQPVYGWARKGSGTPYYKEGPLSGEVSSADGASFTAILARDE